MKTLVSRFVKDESGATAIEYGLIAAGISVVIIAVVNGIGTTLNTKFSSITPQPRPASRSRTDGFRKSNTMKTPVSRFVKDESGATAIEYGLIAAGISVAIIAVVNGIGGTLNTKFTSINTQLR